MAELLQITTLVDRDGATVRLAGELDLSTSRSVDLELERITAEGRPIVVDLQRLDFIDSVGIGLFVGWQHRLGATAGALRIRGASGQVLQVFKVTAMAEHFGLEDDDAAPA
jgi:anti-sigma B factor antagonist